MFAVDNVLLMRCAQLAGGAPEAVKKMVEAECEPLHASLRHAQERCRKLSERLAQYEGGSGLGRATGTSGGSGSSSWLGWIR